VHKSTVIGALYVKVLISQYGWVFWPHDQYSATHW